MNPKNTISLKELSSKLEVSQKTIARHEAAWGLNLCLCLRRLKPKLYYLSKVNRQLLRRKVIMDPLGPT